MTWVHGPQSPVVVDIVASKCTPIVASYLCRRKRCDWTKLLVGILLHMAGSGPAGINGLPRPLEAEYEENGRLYSTFRRYVDSASF